MGQHLSNIPTSTSPENLVKFGHFPSRDVTEWSESFKKEYPSGFITLRDLEAMLKKFFPFGSTKLFSRRLFETLNISQSDQLDFHELLIAFSILKMGSEYEKMRWIFRFYDEDCDGVLSKAEMKKNIQGVVEMVSSTLEVEFDVEEMVEEMFRENESGFMTYEEFKEKQTGGLRGG